MANYAVTSLGPERAPPTQPLALWRGRWAAENLPHAVRDGACDEGRATVRDGHAPQADALRNAANGLIRHLGTNRIAATCRRFLAHPRAALGALA